MRFISLFSCWIPSFIAAAISFSLRLVFCWFILAFWATTHFRYWPEWRLFSFVCAFPTSLFLMREFLIFLIVLLSTRYFSRLLVWSQRFIEEIYWFIFKLSSLSTNIKSFSCRFPALFLFKHLKSFSTLFLKSSSILLLKCFSILILIFIVFLLLSASVAKLIFVF